MKTENDTLAAVADVLITVLQLDQKIVLADSTRLLGGMPEFDSLAVASVVIALEEHFGLVIDDDDINAELFETVGTLAEFIDRHRSSSITRVGGTQAEFLSATSGSLFVVRHDAGNNMDSRCVVFVAPFAEEMNRVRTLMTSTAKHLNETGLSCCCFDFYGTGDSAGEFAVSRWSTWLGDLRDVVGHLRGSGFSQIDLIGIRLGAALALEYVNTFRDDISRLVFWDPVFDGKTYLDRFLRTRTMAAMMTGTTESVKELNERLQNGDSVEVGGYALHPEMAAAIASIVPGTRPVSVNTSLYWIGRDEADRELLTTLAITKVARPDYEPYWASAEPILAPALIETTRQFLLQSAD